MKLKKLLWSAAFFVFVPFVFSAQEEDVSYLELPDNPYLGLNIDELFQVKVEVGTIKAVNQREVPSIVSVITKEEIINSGAKDLLDVLTLFVPGVNFGTDVEGVVGIGIRGFWSHEGKVLLMIDGQECNEDMFGTTQFGGHYSVDVIDRIEMIRGPGSSIYGGYAAVGVINIITKAGAASSADANEKGKTSKVSDKNNFATANYYQMEETCANRGVAFGSSAKAENFSYSLTGSYGEGARSDRDNVDYNGNSLSMKDNSDITSTYLNLNLNAYDFELRTIVDQYHLDHINLWGENYQNGALKEEFDTYLADARYSWKVNNDFQIIPEVKYKLQYPWQLKVYDQEFTNEKHTEKINYLVTGIWDVNDKNNIVFGAEYFTSDIYMPDSPTVYEETFKNGHDNLGYENFSSFAQWMCTNDFVNTTIGGRYDESDEYGSSFVPRVGLTKAWNKFHAKLMYSESFRTPGGIISNRLAEGDTIEAETADNYEVQLGYQITDGSAVSLNFYDMKFKDVIVYESNPETGVGTYRNSGEFGARGVETEFRYQIAKKSNVILNYSFYKVSDNTVALYELPSEENEFLGMPQHRFNIYWNVNLTENFSVTPTLSVYGERYGYAWNEEADDVSLTQFDTDTLCNLNCRWNMTDSMELNFGVRDIFDAEYDYVGAYSSSCAPLPSQTRSYYAKYTYAL